MSWDDYAYKKGPIYTDDTVIVCAPAPHGSVGVFPDDKYGTCIKCQCRVRFRPYHPPHLAKICFKCITITEGDKVSINPRTYAELKLIFDKPGGRA